MIISISGTPGAGKTTVAKALAQKLQWPEYYIGGIRRQLAKEKEMTIEEYNSLGETDPSTDVEVDNYQKKLGKEKDNFIIQGRTTFLFIPHSLKIYLDVDFDVGAQRIWKDMQNNNERNEGTPQNIEELKQSIQKRMNSDILRYKKYYGINCYEKKHYDIIINTTNLTVQEVVQKILDKVKI